MVGKVYRHRIVMDMDDLQVVRVARYLLLHARLAGLLAYFTSRGMWAGGRTVGRLGMRVHGGGFGAAESR